MPRIEVKKIFENFSNLFWNLFAARNAWWIIVLLGGFVRVMYYFHVAMISRDSVHYLDKVQMWINGGGFDSVVAYESCTLPLLGVKFFAWLTGDLLLGGVIFNLIAATGLLIALYFLLHQLTSSTLIANIGTFLMAFNPYLIELSFEVQRENLYLLTGTLWLLFLFRGLQGNWCSFGWAGFFFCLAVNSRYEAYEFLAMTVGAIGFLSKLPVRAKAAALGCCLLGIAVGLGGMMAMGVPLEYIMATGTKRIVSFGDAYQYFFR